MQRVDGGPSEAKPGKAATEAGHVRCGLEYLTARIRLARGEQASSGRADDPYRDPPPVGEAAALLRERATAWAQLNGDSIVVRVVESDRHDLLDLRILRLLVIDRIVSDDHALGISVLGLLRRTGGLAPEAAVAELWRFLSGAPLIHAGLIEVEARDGVRLLGRKVVATPALVEAATGLPTSALAGQEARRTPPFEEPGGAEEEKTDEGTENAASTAGPLVLTPAGQEAFERLVRAVEVRGTCRAQLRLDDLIPGGLGVAALFYGPPGTGKTQGARALARRLDRPLHLIGSSDIVSPYIGQSSKTIDEVFKGAEEANAVLCVDEADALVTRRTDAPHVAYRQVTATLLRALERTSGVVVFTTNLAQDLDPALERRLLLRIEFPRPSPRERRRIWEALLPAALPADDDVNLDAAARVDLSGGEIKNALVAALTEAIGRQPPRLTMADLEAGIAVATSGRFANEHRPAMGFSRP